MTPARFRECLAALRWSMRGLGDMLGLDERQIRRWEDGSGAIPAPVAAWLETLAAAHAANPPPTGRVRQSAA